MSQDQILADFTTLATTDCETFIAQLLAYHTALGTNLFQCALLDDAHRTDLLLVDRAKLIALRNRIQVFNSTLSQAIAAGTF